jgi:DNA-directed RNA polymerase subunit RPC12/RpoP
MSKWARIYRCQDCGRKYRRIEETATPRNPPCPDCGTSQIILPPRIAAPAIVGTKSRAVDEAYRIVSEDYGMTNLRDGAHEGEAAVILPPTPPPNPATITKPAMIWGGATPSMSGVQMPGQPALRQMAAGSAALARAEGKNPLQLLHKAKPKLQAFPVNRE